MINKIFKKCGRFLLAAVLPGDPYGYGHRPNELASFTQFERFLRRFTIFPKTENTLTISLQVLLQEIQFKKHFFDKIYNKFTRRLAPCLHTIHVIK
jgi:hypothetical protein